MPQVRVTIPKWQGTFTSDELNCSIPFDDGRRLQGHSGSELFDEITAIIDSTEVRARKRKVKDQSSHDASIEALLANLLVAAFNRVEPERFVAMPFSSDYYANRGLSLLAMQSGRNALGNAGLLEGVRGHHRQHYMVGQGHAMRTRLRATPALREIFESCRASRGAVKCSRKQVIRINSADANLDFRHPIDIAATASALLSINLRLDGATLVLPDEAWARVGAARTKPTKREDDEDPYIGDLTAISLYRSFKGNWERGGRLYGGWWMNLPKTERSQITIDGEATTELDYGQLHPTLLFARQGLQLNFDPYSIKGHEEKAVRAMGKRTFNRLINPWKGKASKPAGLVHSSSCPSVVQPPVQPFKLRALPIDKAALPNGMSFQQFLDLFLPPLAPIAMYFGSDAGMTLQREDSDLAISILEWLDHAGVVALPVHDSFIVKQSDANYLRQAMTECFYDRHFFNPIIKPLDDHKLASPTVP